MLKIGTQFFADSSIEEPVSPAELTTNDKNEPLADHSEELEALKAELAKERKEKENLIKKADDLASENAKKTKELRSMKSAEELKAEEEREKHEQLKAELEELRKQSAVGNISKKVLSFIGDEKKADSIAEGLYGASDVDLVLESIQKAWNEHEKKLKLEYERLPGPTGGDGEGDKPRKDVEMGKKFGQAKVNAMKYSNDGLKRFMK